MRARPLNSFLGGRESDFDLFSESWEEVFFKSDGTYEYILEPIQGL